MKKQQLLGAVLLTALTTNLLFGCSETSNQTNETVQVTDTAKTESIAYEDGRMTFDVSGINYEGYEFRIWNFDNVTENLWDPEDIPNDIYSEEQNGDMLNDAVYTRNQTVQEALNIKFIVTYMDHNRMSTSLNQAVASGSGDVDVLFPRFLLMPVFVNNDNLLNMADVDFRDTEAQWWNTEANEALNICGKQFGMVSDITYQDKISAIVTYFNQKLAEDYNLGNLYETVINDEWTLDNLLAMGQSISADLNNDGIYDQNDAYPLSCQNDAVYYLLHGGCMRFCEEDADDNIVLSLTDEKVVSALQKIYEIMGTRHQFFNRQALGVSSNEAINMFRENNVMFMIRPIQSLFMMRNMEADFGILPMPKLSEVQEEYGTSVNPYTATFMCFPKTVTDPDRNAVVTEMMALESHYTVITPLYENILGNKLIRDNNASKMLDIVFDSILYDIGIIWNFNNMTTTLITNKDTNISSLLASIQEPIENQIQELTENVLDMD